MALPVKQAIKIALDQVSVDPTRPNIRVVRVERSRTWATDGHRAILLTTDEATDEEIGAYDASGKVEDDIAGLGPAIDCVVPPIETRVVTHLCAGFLEDVRLMVEGTKANVNVGIDFSAARVEFKLWVDPRGKHKDEVPPTMRLAYLGRTVGGADYVPKVEFNFGVNAYYLMAAIDALYGKKLRRDITLRMQDALSPIRIDSPDGTAVIMPMRV